FTAVDLTTFPTRTLFRSAVADELGGHLVGLQNRADQTRRSVTERRHAVEEMGRVTRAGGNGLERLIVGRPGMSQRHAVAARQQPDRKSTRLNSSHVSISY